MENFVRFLETIFKKRAVVVEGSPLVFFGIVRFRRFRRGNFFKGRFGEKERKKNLYFFKVRKPKKPEKCEIRVEATESDVIRYLYTVASSSAPSVLFGNALQVRPVRPFRDTVRKPKKPKKCEIRVGDDGSDVIRYLYNRRFIFRSIRTVWQRLQVRPVRPFRDTGKRGIP
ncbi:hypothetical protein TNIN_80401 [Trichonephila inaurata madagascariensis]|uniref:Uncharacterized protein n=1 Tax=Trichonephila inaurata madagascariensis TaxID=2747483 RepID=A0A8X6Y3V9_9ARAC|nr:hypothetical protein TNIN_80401 [Trichonephila inaurata madagascariensis]